MIEGILEMKSAPISAVEDTDTGLHEEIAVNRREFLTYAWGAAVGLLVAQTGAASYLFLSPRFRVGEFGGKIGVGAAAALPMIGAAPEQQPDGKFWLVNTGAGPRALYMVCTHLGCLYKWNDEDGRFRCPCHGSEFSREGRLVKGPATRGLDQFVVEVVKDGEVLAATVDADGGIAPPHVDDAEVEVVVNTGQRIKGRPA